MECSLRVSRGARIGNYFAAGHGLLGGDAFGEVFALDLARQIIYDIL